MFKNFFELFKDKNNCIIVAITCTIICIVGNYRDFDFVEIGSFKFSFNFIFFIALVFASVAWIVISLNLLNNFILFVYRKVLLRRIKNCTPEEKDFLYNRVYKNGNELKIDINSDSYFYKKKSISKFGGGFTYELYKPHFDTPEKIIKFLRKLENKQIIKNFGNQSMTIPPLVWNVLIKNADKIFEEKKQ